MNEAKISYLKKTIKRHLNCHFTEEAVEAYEDANILWVEWSQITTLTGLQPNTIIIPYFSDPVTPSQEQWEIPFKGKKIKIWGKISPPDANWNNVHTENLCWYKNHEGVYVAAWNLSSISFNLLTLNEETNSNERDKHGRFVAKMSPRDEVNNLEIPFFNNSVALLIELCIAVSAKEPKNICSTKPLKFCLSHDLDQLRGDDFWTQLSRLIRVFAPLKNLKFPDFKHLKFMYINYLNPRKYFFDDLLEMINLEAKFGYRSVQYVLNGRKGRYGARTSSKYLRDYLNEIPDQWPLGMHYNFNTHLDETEFIKQKNEIAEMTGKEITMGRAHYLKMDSKLSFPFWKEQGIQFDETLGYPDKVGFRCGIAGPFYPYNSESDSEIPLVVVPLVAMDSCFFDNYGREALEKVEELIDQIALVGGTFTLLFHPGRFDNIERPETKNLYKSILEFLYSRKAKCVLPDELIQA
jgi:hypothetical protein